MSPKGVLRETQSVGLCLVIWMACGSVSLLGTFYQQKISCVYKIIFRLGALCYAEIGTVIPRNGAEVAYMKEGI